MYSTSPHHVHRGFFLSYLFPIAFLAAHLSLSFLLTSTLSCLLPLFVFPWCVFSSFLLLTFSIPFRIFSVYYCSYCFHIRMPVTLHLSWFNSIPFRIFCPLLLLVFSHTYACYFASFLIQVFVSTFLLRQPVHVIPMLAKGQCCEDKSTLRITVIVSPIFTIWKSYLESQWTGTSHLH
jgi:hypothetical protein